jgi:hypothetical protein
MPGILMKKRLMDPLSRTKIFIEKEGRKEGWPCLDEYFCENVPSATDKIAIIISYECFFSQIK